MYNNANNNAASSFGSSFQGGQASQGYQNNASQYQGYQRQYQPVGYVQSFYSQQPASQSVSGSSQGYNQGFNQQGMTSTESFHTANYRGNQPGHDNYLRSDSSTPTQYQPSSFQNAYSTYNGSNSQNNQYGSNQTQPITYVSSQYGSSTQSNQQPYGQSQVSANSYHLANYRGNQPGHDNYLRSDSNTPSQQSYQSSYGAQQGTQFYGYQQQGQQGQQSYQQQTAQPYNQSFGSSGMGQQFGYNASN